MVPFALRCSFLNALKFGTLINSLHGIECPKFVSTIMKSLNMNFFDVKNRNKDPVFKSCYSIYNIFFMI